MKFGKYLAKRHLDLPEYAQYFLDYKALKKLIKRLAAVQAPDSSAEARHHRLQHNKATFFFRLERELEKVTNFYAQKEAELQTRLDVLAQKQRAAASGALGALTRSSMAYIALHEGLQRFRRDLDRLEQFVELNATGFSKVLKKWDKQSRSHTKELYLSRAVEVQPMFHRDVLVLLNDRSNACLLELETAAMTCADRGELWSANAQPAPSSYADPASDMFYEFVRFAETYIDGDAMLPWIHELQSDISQAFLRALPTAASDAAMLALWQAGVDPHAKDVVANRNALHLCAQRAPVNATGTGRERSAYCETNWRMPVFEAALRAGADPNAADANGRTPLIAAATHERRDLLLRLLAAGADPNVRDHDNLTALHYAIFHSYLGCAEDLLDAGAQTGGLDSERQYVPLNFACQHGARGAVELLLRKRGSDAMVADAEGLSPLHIVARAGYADIVADLVSAGAAVNEKDKLNGWTPLIYAAAEGHSRATAALLAAGADTSLVDEKGRSALFYAAWEGHPSCFKLLAEPATGPTGAGAAPAFEGVATGSAAFEGAATGPAGATSAASSTSSAENATSASVTASTAPSTSTSTSFGTLDTEIPDLALPPPIMPLKRYGHTFLDPDTIIVQIKDVQVHLSDRRGLRAGRLTLTSSLTRDSIPRNLVLPVRPHEQVQTFEVGTLSDFSVAFDVMPAFGTRPLARTVAAAGVFGDEQGRHARQVQLPLLDTALRPAGVLEFAFLVVKPFCGPPLEISKHYTYWKSTAHEGTEEEQAANEVTLSYVTASSLHGDYKRLVVTLTKDLIPVVCDIRFKVQDVAVPTPLFTLKELQSLLPAVLTLDEWLGRHRCKLNVHVPFPTLAESESAPVRWPAMNVYVDRIIDVVFQHARQAPKQHGLVFSSTHPEICAMFNWKQPNFPVLFCATAMRADGLYTTANRLETSEDSLGELPVCKSLREASIYAATNHLMGIVAPADVLATVPAVVPAIRQTGLVLVSCGGSVEGTDGVLSESSLEFPKDIGM